MAFALARMKSFTVYLHPQRRPLAEHAQFVPEGFNLWAFAFGWLWAFSQRMWWHGLGLLAVVVTLKALELDGVISPLEAGIIEFAVAVMVGFEANDWRRSLLAKRGWLMSDIVAEDSLLHAQQRYFARHANLLQPAVRPDVATVSGSPWGVAR